MMKAMMAGVASVASAKMSFTDHYFTAKHILGESTMVGYCSAAIV